MAGRAPEALPRLRGFELVLDGPLEAPIEEDRVIVAAGAPLAALRAAQLLHVENRGAVELVVEGRVVVHRSAPLLVDIFVALATQLRVHEEVGGNQPAGVGIRRRWPERRLRSRALFSHRHPQPPPPSPTTPPSH